MILYFTGTGNSGLIARRLSELLGDEAVRLEYPFVKKITTADKGRIIWVFPIYSWGIPPVVKKLISEIEIASEVEHFMVCSCGDDIGKTAEDWRKLLKRRGWRPIGTWSVQMPNIYVLLPGFNTDSKFIEHEKLVAANARIEVVARGIKHSARVDDVVKGSVPWIKSRILRPLFVRFLMSPRPFHSDEHCTGCGKCARNCPMRNIEMKSSKPLWGKRCALCLECYHCCPVHSVCYGRITNSKGQYKAPSELPPVD